MNLLQSNVGFNNKLVLLTLPWFQRMHKTVSITISKVKSRYFTTFPIRTTRVQLLQVQGRRRTICDAWHFLSIQIIDRNMTSHPVKKAGFVAKIKFEGGMIVLSVSKMAIPQNRPDIFNVLFYHDKQFFNFSLVTCAILFEGQGNY